jgi:hypothetical protein
MKTTGILMFSMALGALHLPDASMLVDQIMATKEQVGGFIFISLHSLTLGNEADPRYPTN